MVSVHIRFIGNIYFQIPLTSTCLIISNFALCGIPFLAGFYSKDLILEIVSLDYVNLLGYFLFYFSTGLTVCYSFRLFYYTLCGDFNLTTFYNIGEENKNIIFGIITLLIIVILGGSLIRWIIFPTPSIICLPIYLKIIVIFVTLVGGLIGYEISKIGLGKILLSIKQIYITIFLGSIWNIPYISTYGVSFGALICGYNSLKSFDNGWNELFGGQGLYIILINLRVNGSIDNRHFQTGEKMDTVNI